MSMSRVPNNDERLRAAAFLQQVFGPDIDPATAAAGTTLIRVATLEQIHRAVRSIDSVRTFTVLDVVASTSVQVGLLVAGPVIAASAPGSHVDPYRVLVAAAAAATLGATLHAARRPAGRAG